MAPITKTPKNMDEQRAGAYVGPRAANGRAADPTASSVDSSADALVDPTASSVPFDASVAPDPTASQTEAMTATETVTPSLGVIAAEDRCANCGYPMAADQRYCIECGERRGQARFAAAPTRTASRATTVSEPVFRSSRFSPGTTLIAGVATLLLAMGIGVLIGEQGNSSGSGNSKTPVIYLNGNSTSAGSGASSSGTGATGSQTSGGNGGHRASTAGSSGGGHSGGVRTVKSAVPPTVTVGSQGSGKGYQHGHFTGNFFGP